MELSGSQKRAIAHDRGHLRIIACPGSGKTETVSRRVAELVRKGADPSKIVAFTFTRKAAEGLKARIRRMLEGSGADIGGMYVGTIDSFCLYMLKKIRPEYRQFEVLDSARRAAFVDRWYLHIGLDELDSSAGKWRTARTFCESADIAVAESVDLSRADPVFARCHARYAEKLREERFFDFVSIIDTLIGALEGSPADLGLVGGEVKHVVFDEYQDVNGVQERLLELLSRGADSVCVVGDDDQNIFQWRGSSVEHILRFPSKYADRGVTTEELGTNYRATDALVRIAGRLIGNNRNRVEKDMSAHAGQPNRFEHGDIVHRHFGTDSEEFKFVCDAMEGLRGTGFAGRDGAVRPLAYRDMAVIVRTNEDGARAAAFLSERGIPCVTDSGAGIFNRPVVSLAIDCIMYAFDKDGYGIGGDGTDGTPEMGGLEGRYAEAVPRGDMLLFADRIREVRELAEIVKARGDRDWLPDLGLQEFYQRVLSAMGAERGVLTEIDMYGLAVLSKAISDYEYVYRFLRARQVGGLPWFIRNVEYADPSRADPGRTDAVRIMTIWKAKGLEFPAVFVPAFDDRRRPPYPRLFIDERLYESGRYKGGEEDDRRAYYTAVTRSQKYLFLTSASRAGPDETKKRRGPHAFVAEMDGVEISESAPERAPAPGPGAAHAQDGLVQSSYSELASYDRCPYEYQIRHVMGFNPGVPAVFDYGTCIHNILNYLHESYIRGGGAPDEARIRSVFDDMFYLRFAPVRQTENLKENGIDMVSRYVRRREKDFAMMRETEKRFEFDVGGAVISGSIDLVSGTGGGSSKITDFKVNRDRDGGYELDHAEQVRLYACAARASLGFRPEAAAIHKMYSDRAEAVDVGDEQLAATEEKTGHMVRMIASKRFEPDPDDRKCRACDFRALCQHKGFEVGPKFSRNKAHERSEAERAAPDERAGAPREPVMSAGVAGRAGRLASSVAANADGSFSVPSLSDPGRSYTITADMKCKCRGFREYPHRHPGTAPTCSHVEAVKRFLRS